MLPLRSRPAVAGSASVSGRRVGSGRPGARSVARLSALLLALAVLAGCSGGGSSPAPSPLDFEGLVGALGRRHVEVSNVVSGDAGCTDPALIPTSIGFTARGLDQPTPVRVHVFLFKDDASYRRLRQAVDACAASFVSSPDRYVSVDASPFVLASEGPWATAFTAAMRAALSEAAGG